jgi:hypothetical protein
MDNMKGVVGRLVHALVARHRARRVRSREADSATDLACPGTPC